MGAETNRIPWSFEAEQAVLGAVILKPDEFQGVKRRLRVADFVDYRHRVMWEALVRLDDAGKAPDPVLLLDECRVIEPAGDRSTPCVDAKYIAETLQASPCASNAALYAEDVRELAGKRALYAIGMDLISASGQRMSLSALASIAARKIDRVAAYYGRDGDGMFYGSKWLNDANKDRWVFLVPTADDVDALDEIRVLAFSFGRADGPPYPWREKWSEFLTGRKLCVVLPSSGEWRSTYTWIGSDLRAEANLSEMSWLDFPRSGGLAAWLRSGEGNRAKLWDMVLAGKEKADE